MLGELELARVKGLGYSDYLVDVVRLVRHYIKELYSTKYPMLNQFNIDKEDVEMRVYQSLFNRTDGSKYNNMEKYFIKASELAGDDTGYNDGTKYLVSLIRRVVTSSLSELSRTLLRKGAIPPVSYDKELSDYDGNTKPYIDYLEGTLSSVDMYDGLIYDDFLNSLPLKKFNYYITIDGKRKTLNSRLLLDLYVTGYSSKEIASMSINKETGVSPTPATVNKLKSMVVDCAKKYFNDYFGE